MKFWERKEYSRPLPELLDGDDWEARNSCDLKVAYVDFKKKEFVVPFLSGPSGELIRAHEAMHVKISPRKHDYSKADFVTYQAVEDARIHQGLRIADIATDRGRVWRKDEIKQIFENNIEAQTPLRVGEAFFATKGLAEEEDIREVANNLFPTRPEILKICEKIYEKYIGKNERNSELSSEEEVNKCVKELREKLKEVSTDSEKERDRRGELTYPSEKKKKNLTQTWIPGSSDRYLDEQELPVLTDEEAEDIDNALPKDSLLGFCGEAGPGEMEIQKPKFDTLIKFKKVRSVKLTASDEGVIPTRMHRYTTDMRVFSAKGRRRTNAAVLLDVSGSMGLSEKQIEDIVKQCPASIVAIYSARTRNGILRIIAEKNRFYSKTKEGMGGSNVVDFPALQWLAKRPEKKKLWISDGRVTGIGDTNLEDLYLRKIVNLVRTARIERIGSVKELLDSGKLIDSAFDDGHEIGTRHLARVVGRDGKDLRLSGEEYPDYDEDEEIDF